MLDGMRLDGITEKARNDVGVEKGGRPPLAGGAGDVAGLGERQPPVHEHMGFAGVVRVGRFEPSVIVQCLPVQRSQLQQRTHNPPVCLRIGRMQVEQRPIFGRGLLVTMALPVHAGQALPGTEVRAPPKILPRVRLTRGRNGCQCKGLTERRFGSRRIPVRERGFAQTVVSVRDRGVDGDGAGEKLVGLVMVANRHRVPPPRNQRFRSWRRRHGGSPRLGFPGLFRLSLPAFRPSLFASGFSAGHGGIVAEESSVVGGETGR